MKAFLVLPFLLLLLAGNSQESALSRKRSIRGLNTTLQTNFNGTFQIKNPCTNADLETSSYLASHEFHHHIKENNWSDYLQKCSAVINSFLRGVGNLVRVNSKQNTAFNFHVNTSISQKQDIGDCEKQCEPLPTIVIEAESCELPPPCKSSQKVRSEYLLKQDVRHSDKIPDNYLTTPPAEDSLKEGFDVEEKQQKDQNYGSIENATPISRFSTSTVQAGTGGTNDLSQNQKTTSDSEFFATSGRDFTASITIKPEDELTPAPWQDCSEGSLYANPETQDYPYSTPTISEYQTTPRPNFNDEKIINSQYEVDQKRNFGDLGEEILDQGPVRSSTSKSESIRVEKPFRYQHNIPLGLAEPDYVDEMIPPSERFQSADLQTPYPQILDRYPLQQQTQSIDDINAVSKQKEKILPQGDSLAFQPRLETSYPSQKNELEYLTTPSDDCLTSPPSNPSILENDFQPKLTSTNEFSKSKFESITDIYTPLTEQPPREKFPTELPTETPNFSESSYPDVYTVVPEKPTNDFYVPAAPDFRKNGKIPLPVDKLDDFSSTISPVESVTIYDSDEDVFDDRLSSPTFDEESYIKSQSFPPSAFFPKDQNEKTAPNYSPVSSDGNKNPEFESFKPNFMTPKPTAQLESDSKTILQPKANYPEVEVPRFPNFENPSLPPKRNFEPTTTSPPVNYSENEFYRSDYRSTPENPPPSTLEPIAYAEASSQASTKVEEQGFNDFENPSEPPKPKLESVAYAEASSRAVVKVEKPGSNDFENPDQPRRNFEPIRTSPPLVRTYPEDDFYPSDYPSTPENSPPSTSERVAYSRASSQASAKVEEQGFNDFENPSEPPKPKLESVAYSRASSQAFAKTAEAFNGFNDFENADQASEAFEPITNPPPPLTYPEDDYPLSPENPPSSFEPIAYSRASSRAVVKVEKPGFNDFENPDQPRRNFEPIRSSPSSVGTYPEDDFYPSTPENPSASTFEPIAYSGASSHASAKVENFVNADQPPRPRLEPTAYAESSSQTFADSEEQRFNDFENSDEQSRQFFESTTTSPLPVTYPEDDFYSSDYPSTPENPQLSTSESIGYSKTSSQASVKVKEQGFDDFVKPDERPEAFEPITSSVTYPENDFYTSDYPSTLENPTPSASEPIAYSRASSQAFAKVEEQGFNDFENPDQPPRPMPEPTVYSKASSQTTTKVEEHRFNDFVNPDERPEAFEPITSPVTYSENGFYPSDYPSTLENPTPSASEPIAYSRASSQAFAKVEKQGFNDFENSDQESRRSFERTTTPPLPVTNPRDDFDSSDYTSTPENPQLSTSESIAYSKASSQASVNVKESSFDDFENPDQPETPFEPKYTTSSPVNYPEEDSYLLDNRRTLEYSPIFTRPPTPLKTFESRTYADASSQASAEVEENSSQPPNPRFESVAYSRASSQASAKVKESSFNDFENADQRAPEAFESITTPPPPLTYPEDDFYPSSPENPPPSTSERVAYSRASSQAFAKTAEAFNGFNDFENADQASEAFEPITNPPPPLTYPEDDYPLSPENPPSSFEPIAYSRASSRAVVKVEKPGFNDFENPDQPRRNFEPIRTSPPLVRTYPEDDFYPSTPENPSASTFEPIAYSRASSHASAKVEEQGFDDFENPDERPEAFEPITPSVTYPEKDFYPSDYPPSVENPTTSTPESIAYSRASSQAFAKVEKQGFNDFENSDQESRRSFERATTPPLPVTYPKGEFYSSDYPSTLEDSTPSTSERINYSKASSQTTTKVEEQGFNDFESPDQPPRPTLEPTAYSESSSQTFADMEEPGFNDFENPDQPPKAFEPVTPAEAYPKNNFYVPTSESQLPLTFESVAYSRASSQASAKVKESSFNDFENQDQPIRNFSPSSLTYPEDGFYRKSDVNGPQSTPPFEVFEPNTFAEAESKVLDIQEPRLPNFENPDQQSRQSFERTTTPAPPVTYPEDDFYPSDYRGEMGFERSMTSDSEDHSTDYLPTTQPPDNLSFSSFKTQADAQSKSIIRNDYNEPEPTDLPPEENLPLWTKRPGEPQSLPGNVENADVVLSEAQSDLPFNRFESQPPLDYSDERVFDSYSQKPLAPLDTTSIPQRQSEEKTTSPLYQDYTSREELFAGDSTPSQSQEEMLIYSPPFEPEPQPQPQPSSYIPGDKISAAKTFENFKTSNLLSSSLESQDRSSFGTTLGYTQSSDFLTTPTPLTDIPSFQTPLGSKPEEIMTDSQDNINTQETLFFGDNVSPRPQPTTAVKTYKEILTTEYQTSPAPSPQPQTAMNFAYQHSDDNLNGKIPELFTNQQQLVTSEPDFDLQTSESFSQSEQVTENHQKMTDYSTEGAPQPPVNYPNPNSFLPYNNQLRSQPIYRQPPPPRQESPMKSPQNPSENFKQDVQPVREEESEPPLRDSRILASSRMEPEDNEWMWRSNEQVPFLPDDSLRSTAPDSQIPPERFLHPEQNYNARERYFSQESRREPPPNFPPSSEPRRPFNPDFQRELITDSRTNSYNRPQSFDSDSESKKTKFEEETESEKQSGYQEEFFNDKRISEQMTDDRRFEPSENYHPSERQYKPRNFPQHPQQVEPFYEGFPPNTSYPDYEQIRPQNDFSVSERDYPQYDQVFPNPPQFVHDEVVPPSMSNTEFDQRAPDVNENQYYPERPQRPENYLPDREPLYEKQQHPNPLFQTLEDQIKIPLQEPPLPEMPNESRRNYFQDNSSGWESPNPPSPLPESQPVPDLSVPSNNPDRAANGRFNYMDRPLRKPFYEDRMRPVSAPERF